MNNIKRAELHIHTKLSDDISVIGVKEIFEKAEELGLDTVAFTNFDNVQDFPEIMRYAKKYEGIKVVYGAELRYMNENGVAPFGITVLAKNQDGIKELYKVLSSIKDDGVCNLIDLDILKKNRKNLLVGSCGNMGALYDAIAKSEYTEKIAAFYDYFEIYPTKDKTEKDIYKKIFDLGEELGVPVIATGNCHYLSSDDAICREVVITARNLRNKDNGELYVRSTKQMLEEFSYLGNYGAEKVVLKNPQIITDIIEKAEPLKEGNYYPIFENAYSDLEKICYSKAYEFYGNPLPEKIKERLDTELGFLKDEQAASQYLLAKKLVDYAKEKGKLTTARGAVGSTLVAFLLGIGDINPLPPHYYCNCRYLEFSKVADDGFDLPEKVCPVCNRKLRTDGHNIPYEVFMGFNGDKEPDIDLNFPEDFRLAAQKFVEDMFGKTKVVQAGTVATVWDGIAEKYIQEYEATKNISFKPEEKENLITKIVGIKRNVGMHPGGIIVIPQDMDFEDFTPIYCNWAPRSTTHFDFHSLHDTIYKADILGYTALDLLLTLQKKTSINIKDVCITDQAVIDDIAKGDTFCIPSFDKDIVRDMLIKSNPKNFNELVKVSGFAHGTNVWTDNGEWLLENGISVLKIPTLRDDIMNDLIRVGADRADAFKIGESVRKGLFARGRTDEELENLFKELSKPLGDWYFEFCKKVRYMFPKSHAIEYVIIALQLAWFKKYYPKDFYEAYLDCYLSDTRNLTEEEKEKYKIIKNILQKIN